jgi:hypothetical protein
LVAIHTLLRNVFAFVKDKETNQIYKLNKSALDSLDKKDYIVSSRNEYRDQIKRSRSTYTKSGNPFTGQNRKQRRSVKEYILLPNGQLRPKKRKPSKIERKVQSRIDKKKHYEFKLSMKIKNKRDKLNILTT